MICYHYTAIDLHGGLRKGSMRAHSEQCIHTKCAKKGWRLLQLEAIFETKVDNFFFRRPLNEKQLSQFSRELSHLLDAGMPLLKASTAILKNTAIKGTLYPGLSALVARLEQGEALSKIVLKYRQFWGTVFCSSICAAERAGQVPIVLMDIANWADSVIKFKRRMTSALIYPIVVLLFSMGILMMLFFFLIPQFEMLFSNLMGPQASLPWMTAMILKVSTLLRTHPVGVLIAFLGIVVLGLLTIRFHIFKRIKIFLMYRFPVLCSIMQLHDRARFLRTLALLYKNAVPLHECIQLLNQMFIENPLFTRGLKSALSKLREGKTLSQVLYKNSLLPIGTVRLLQAAEESGRLSQVLDHLGEVEYEAFDDAMRRLMALIEPLLIVVIAFIVGAVLLALFLPLMDLMGMIQF